MFVIDPRYVAAHKSGDIHIHDLDFYTLTTTCCQIDLIKLFEGGFSTGHGVLREPNDIASYSALACIAIQSNQNDQHGGQSIVNFDYGMAPGVAKTFAKKYREFLSIAFSLLCDEAGAEGKLSEAASSLKKKGIVPKLENEKYLFVERELLLEAGFSEELVSRTQAFADERAQAATQRAYSDRKSVV